MFLRSRGRAGVCSHSLNDLSFLLVWNWYRHNSHTSCLLVCNHFSRHFWWVYPRVPQHQHGLTSFSDPRSPSWQIRQIGPSLTTVLKLNESVAGIFISLAVECFFPSDLDPRKLFTILSHDAIEKLLENPLPREVSSVSLDNNGLRSFSKSCKPTSHGREREESTMKFVQLTQTFGLELTACDVWHIWMFPCNICWWARWEFVQVVGMFSFGNWELLGTVSENCDSSEQPWTTCPFLWTSLSLFVHAGCGDCVEQVQLETITASRVTSPTEGTVSPFGGTISILSCLSSKFPKGTWSYKDQRDSQRSFSSWGQQQLIWLHETGLQL